MKATRNLIFALFATSLMSACVYKLDNKQGHLIDKDLRAQVTVGMSRTDVEKLIGTPLIQDPYAKDRWDYITHMKDRDGNLLRHEQLTVIFNGNTVSQVVRIPEDTQSEVAQP